MLLKLVGLAAVFTLALAGTMLYLSRPTHSASPPTGSREGSALPAGATYRPPAGSGSEVRIGESDLHQLVRTALEGHPNGQRALRLAKELRTEIDDGRIEIGLLINLSAIPPEELDEKERETIAEVIRYLPFLEKQDLYIAVNGVPTARGGKVAVERDLRVKLAFLSLPITEMGELFGVDTAPLQERLLLDLSPFRAQEVEVLDEEVVIRLTASG